MGCLALFGCGASSSAVPANTPAAPGAGERPPREPLPADIVARSALPLHAQAGNEKLAEPELWDRMAGYRVVCLGEQHDSPQHHYAQRRSIEELSRRNAEKQQAFAVGFEMWQTPYQPALSSFVAGESTEEKFLADSEYRDRWGFDFALYRPLLEVAREQHLPALALNAPRELTRKISRNGMASLEAGDKAQLPELDLANAQHRAYFDKAMSGHPVSPGMPKPDDMYAVQVVWDETMADTAAHWLQSAGPSSRLVVVAGSGHCHQSAIPARLSRRLGEPVLSTTAVLASKLGELEPEDRYDWLLVLDDSAAPAP
ncbi:MAG TPA: ChaN family lipoprotein [Polyangiaceae bacterium]|nr:ChaN family lipoprotein [Polyangiaceae bacterium]